MKMTPESKKSVMLMSPTKVTQAMRMTNLEQRLKDRKTRASSIKFYEN